MTTQTLTIILISALIYGSFAWLTFRTIYPKNPDTFDRVIIPILCIVWPLPWIFVLLNEIVGYFRASIALWKRKRRQAKKEKQRLERFKKMNQ